MAPSVSRQAGDDVEAAPRLFGTDGIRARYGEGPLAPGRIDEVLAAAAYVLEERERFGEDFPSPRGRMIVVGRDTRSSGADLLAAIAAVFHGRGWDVVDLGVLPTPGVAAVASAWDGVALGVVLSASHNPAEYNGIKFFSPTGAKISPAFERAVECACHQQSAPAAERSSRPAIDRQAEARHHYVSRIVGCCRHPERLAGQTIALDTANGATFEVAPEIFRQLGANVELLGHRPDGTNINLDSGALHPENLAARARENGAALGFCFDGDGDRMIPVTGVGTILDGDHVLALAGRRLAAEDRLPGGVVVATVMSNVGLEIALRERGIDLLRTDVGDRNVYLEMVAGSHPVGGEQSGHTIFLDDARTGDGILSAVRLLDLLADERLDLEGEARVMSRFPQVLSNLEVTEKVPFAELGGVLQRVREVEEQLAGRGRVLLRYSGTEPLARVMVEGPDEDDARDYAESICQAIAAAGVVAAK
jgi:phosphoglucosamine mutase